MKPLPAFIALAAAFALSIPQTSFGKDRHDRGRGDHHHHHHSHYCPPSVSYHSYRPYPYYPVAPSYYSSYPSYYSAYPSYYSRPSIGISFTTGPSYASYSRTVRSVSTGDDLAADVQRALARRGYYRGSIDGDVGPATRGAIREFQYRNRLEVTGRIDRSLLRSLGLS